MRTPASLPRPHRVVELIKSTGSLPIRESRLPYQRDMVEAEVPDSGIDHAVSGERHCYANDRASEDIIQL